jgi:uncharacterized membrane protein
MDTRRLIFGILFACIVALLLVTLNADKRYSRGASSHQMAVDSFFLALIFVMGLVPQFGYITIFPGFSLTLVHIPVLIGAYLYGPKKGALYGFFFGLTSFLAALLQPVGFNGFFVYPWVSIPSRVLFGFLAGLIFLLERKNTKIYTNGFVIGATSFVLTCVHTVLVFLDLYVFFPSETKAFLFANTTLGTSLVVLVLGFLAIGMAGEATLASLVVPVTGKSVLRFIRNK